MARRTKRSLQEGAPARGPSAGPARGHQRPMRCHQSDATSAPDFVGGFCCAVHCVHLPEGRWRPWQRRLNYEPQCSGTTLAISPRTSPRNLVEPASFSQPEESGQDFHGTGYVHLHRANNRSRSVFLSCDHWSADSQRLSECFVRDWLPDTSKSVCHHFSCSSCSTCPLSRPSLFSTALDPQGRQRHLASGRPESGSFAPTSQASRETAEPKRQRALRVNDQAE